MQHSSPMSLIAPSLLALLSPAMADKSVLLVPSPDPSFSVLSRFALMCIANFALGFGAGFLFASLRSRQRDGAETTVASTCTSAGGDVHAANSPESSSVSVSSRGIEKEPLIATALKEANDSEPVLAANGSPDDKLAVHHSDDAQRAHVAEAALLPDTIATSPIADDQVASGQAESPTLLVEESLTAQLDSNAAALKPASVHVAETVEPLKSDEFVKLDDHINKTVHRTEPPTPEPQSLPNQTPSPALSSATLTSLASNDMSVSSRAFRLTSLFVYPIKSCAPMRVQSARVTALGFENDRVFMVVDFTGRGLTQKKFPQLALVTPTILEDGRLRLDAPGQQHVEVVPRSWGSKVDASAQGIRCDAIDQGDHAADFFARHLEVAGVRLVRIREGAKRVTPATPNGAAAGETAFADAYPYLLATEPSRRQVETWVGRPIPMERFRPNIVVDGDFEPFAEDMWKTLSVAKSVFHVVKPCSRCKVVTIDPVTGNHDEDDEPSRALRRFRRAGPEVHFGQNLVPDLATGLVDLKPADGNAAVKVGDVVTIVAITSGAASPTVHPASPAQAKHEGDSV